MSFPREVQVSISASLAALSLVLLVASAGNLVTAHRDDPTQVVPLTTEQRVLEIPSLETIDQVPNAIVPVLLVEAAPVIETVAIVSVPLPVVVAPAVVSRVVAMTRDEASIYAIVATYFAEQTNYAYGVTLCESGTGFNGVRVPFPAINTGNGHYGMFQFNLDTWYSVGGTGLPSDASAEEQTMRARMLYDLRGWQPWACAT